MSIDLSNRVCLITGAGQGIGAGIVAGFRQRGATVVATDLKAPDLDADLSLAWDVADADRADAVVGEVVETFGKLDALVANAGIYPRQQWHDVTDDDWRKVLAINLDGAWYGARAACSAMVKQNYGKIVFVTSVEVQLGVDIHTHYDSSKAGVIGLTRSLSRAVGKDGIRVNAVMPGAVRTEGELSQFADQEAIAKFCAERQCLPHRLLPEGIEPSFAFLCSGESDAVTGQVLCVDHGLIHY